MAKTEPAPDWTAEEAIQRCPQAEAVFIRRRMACVGCVMARFETLAEAAAAYHMKPRRF
jgi:hybrid cluster-associated redox disulfide protein